MNQLQERRQKLNEVKILIIRLKPLGDTVLISPIFRNIKKLYPEAKIDVVIYSVFADVIKNNPYIDNVIILKRKSLSPIFYLIKSLFRRYDVIIDYINTPLSAAIALFNSADVRIGNYKKRNFFFTHRLRNTECVYSTVRNLRKLEPLGLTDFSDYLPDLYLDEKDIARADNFLHGLPVEKGIIGLFVSSKTPSKQYPVEYFARLGTLIAKNTPYHVLFLCGRGDMHAYSVLKELACKEEKIHVRKPDTTLGEFSALISRLKFFIANDSGPKHIATALNIPTLTIFSTSTEKMWNPPDIRRFPVIREKIDCAPCHKAECPLNTMKCMKDLHPEEVFSVFEKTINIVNAM